MNSNLSWMDGVSVGSIMAALTGMLPVALTTLATLLAIIWYGMMINDWVQTRRDKRAATIAAQVVTKAAQVAAAVVTTAQTVSDMKEKGMQELKGKK